MKKGEELSYEQFSRLMKMVDEVTEAVGDDKATVEEGSDDANLKTNELPSADKVSSSLTVSNDDDDEEEEDEPTEEELDEMARSMFNDLSKGASTLPVKRFLKWDGIRDEIKEGTLLKEEVNQVIRQVDPDGKGTLDVDQFMVAMDTLESIMDDRLNGSDDDEDNAPDDDEDDDAPDVVVATPSSRSSTSTGKGFGKAAKQEDTINGDDSNNDVEILAVTESIYNDLKGKRRLLSVAQFKQWADLDEMIESGTLKRSTLEKAIVRVGCSSETGDMTLKQFSSVLDLIQSNVELSNLNTSLLTSGVDSDDNKSPPGAPIVSGDSTATVPGDYADVTEFDEVEAAREIFDELKGASKNTLSLGAFLRWDDVQELIERDALSKDDLALAIEQCGITLDKGDESSLTFEMV
jgi:hypothetical protein